MLVSVGYAVMTDQRNRHVTVQFERITQGAPTVDLFFKPPSSDATWLEADVCELRRPYDESGARPQNCHDCMSWSTTRD